MKNFEEIMEQVRNDITKLAKEYDVSETRIVWMGNNKYTVVTINGKQIVVTV